MQTPVWFYKRVNTLHENVSIPEFFILSKSLIWDNYTHGWIIQGENSKLL